MELTPVYGFQKPEVGERDWGDNVNQNWDLLETTLQALVAGETALTPEQEELIENAAQKGVDYLDVKDYGAVGDGTTDNRQAFIDTIAACNTLGIKKMRVPPGTYMISDPVQLSSFLVIEGSGARNTIIKATSDFGSGSQTGVFVMTTANATFQDIEIRDLCIDTTAIGDQTTNRYNAIFQDFCQVRHFKARNLFLYAATGGQCILFNGLGGMSNGTAAESYDLTFENIHARNGAGTISLYLNATNVASTYHSVYINNIFSIVDINGVIDDRIVIVGAQPQLEGDVTPASRAIVEHISVNNIFTRVAAGITTGLVHGVKFDTGRNCELRSLRAMNIYFIGNGNTTVSGAPFICLIGTNAALYDYEVDGVYGKDCARVRARFLRSQPLGTVRLRNFVMRNCHDATSVVEMFCSSTPGGDEQIIIENMSLESLTTLANPLPIGLLLTGGSTGSGASGVVAIRNIATAGCYTGLSNKHADNGSALVTSWTNITVEGCLFSGATTPVDLANTYKIRNCSGLDDRNSTGINSFAHGLNAVASGSYSTAHGRSAVANRYGVHAFASGQFLTAGDVQRTVSVVRRQTSSATALELSLDGGTPGNAPWTIEASKAYAIRATILARRTDADTEVSAWTMDAVVSREATGNARIIGTPTATVIAQDGTPTWAVTLDSTLLSTNNRLAFRVVGEASKTINWAVSIEALELGG